MKVFDLAATSRGSLGTWKRYRFILRTQAQLPRQYVLAFEGSTGPRNGSTIALDNISLSWRQLMLSPSGSDAVQEQNTKQGAITGLPSTSVSYKQVETTKQPVVGSSQSPQWWGEQQTEKSSSTKATEIANSSGILDTALNNTGSQWWSWWDREPKEPLFNETKVTMNLNSTWETVQNNTGNPWWSWWDREPEEEPLFSKTNKTINFNSTWAKGQNNGSNPEIISPNWWEFEPEISKANNSSNAWEIILNNSSRPTTMTPAWGSWWEENLDESLVNNGTKGSETNNGTTVPTSQPYSPSSSEDMTNVVVDIQKVGSKYRQQPLVIHNEFSIISSSNLTININLN
jgi:hypothetical protein